MSTARVLVIDDHPPLREGIASIVERSERFTVSGTAGSIVEAVELLKNDAPDIAIVDLTLPDGNGLDIVRKVSAWTPGTRILVLTVHARKKMADAVIEAGAHGYLLKESGADLLLLALDRIMNGETYVDPKMLTARPAPGCSDPPEPGEGVDSLSPREREVFAHLAVGRSTKELADLLGISAKTVDNHRARIMQKLCLNSTAELVRLAIRAGIIDP